MKHSELRHQPRHVNPRIQDVVSQEDFVFSVYINKNTRYFLAIFHKELQKNKYSHTGVWSF